MWGTGLLNGLRITMLNMLRGPITVKYPYEKLELPERARWAVRPKFDEAGAPKCTACMTCVRQCPDHILDLEITTAEDKSKHIDHFSYELGACMMCGLCVEACPFDAIEMSHDYELAVTDAAGLVIDLLTDVDAASARANRDAAVARPPRPKADTGSRSEDPAGESASESEASAAEDSERRDAVSAEPSEDSERRDPGSAGPAPGGDADE